jgi:hypothetical protein
MISAACKDRLMAWFTAEPKLAAWEAVRRNCDFIANEYAREHPEVNTTAALHRAWATVRRLPCAASACTSLFPPHALQDQSLAPADYWVSESTVWNYKISCESQVYKLHEDQATSIRMYVETHKDDVFLYQEQVSEDDGKGGRKVRRPGGCC